MRYRVLGASGMKVSALCLGTMMFGGRPPDEVALRILDNARERGLNFIDTADVYTGALRAVVGQRHQGHARRLGAGDQVRNFTGNGPERGRLSRNG